MSERIVLHNVRISYAHVFQPHAFEGQEPKHSAQFILPKDHPEAKKFYAALVEKAKEKWPAKVTSGKFPGSLTCPLRDGDTEFEDREEYRGCYFFNARSAKRPQLFQPDKSQLTEDDNLLFSGDYVNVSVSLFTYDKGGNRGVGVALLGVQFKHKGEPLGGHGDCTDDFEEEEVEAAANDDLL